MLNRKKERTDSAIRALAAYGEYSPDDLDASMSDLLADMMHLAEANTLNFDALLESAGRNYEDERLDYDAMPDLPECIEDAELPRREEEDPNRKRANRVAKVVELGVYHPDGLEWYSAIADILKDLRHLADKERVDFDCALEMSQGNYDMEIREDTPI